MLGGIFSEGIDLIGDRLIGVAVIGTGIPQIGFEREVLKDYYDQKGESGFDYAYRYPGMNKVLQAAGRVIRTREDTGCLLYTSCHEEHRRVISIMKKVVKFGGSSLANAEQFKKVGDIIKSEESRRYVVPSAPGKRYSCLLYTS